ncbi:prolyl oligopeptidase family serine peptidase [Actinophytocola sp.]|uniref:S9 family peptidase n=1 Tax=Actinophytocola sp. TaxID=1872138 RepID=UPI002D7EF62B|nr:alpha/beta fold hydrolase [Actinophytocola sp.]HET9140778.1 alpha/beta fold hydrolase [Actinophytocola sp.]
MRTRSLPAPRRISFRFSPHGTRAACLREAGGVGHLIESWSFVDDSVAAHQGGGETEHTQPMPTEAGPVVLVRNGSTGHEVAILDGGEEQTVGRFDCPGLRAVPSPRPDTLAWLIARQHRGTSVLHRIGAADRTPEPVAELPGQPHGESWLAGDRLAANLIGADGRRLVTIDPRDGSVTTHAGPEGPAVLLASTANDRLLVVARTATGPRLGWFSPGATGVDLSAELNAIPGTVLPLTFDPTGRRLALRVTDGARSRLVIHDTDRHSNTEIAVPPGVIGTAGWSDTGLRFVFSGPTRPADVATAGAVAPDDWRVDLGPAPHPDAHDARLRRFAGPDGPIEAVCYGPEPSLARHVVLALHGGPEAAWQLGFDRVFQRLAAAGIAVVAPNQRGSTGYGSAHRQAINGAWGGPDLADIRHLGVRLGRSGRAPMLFGTSYGAFLALLAAATEPAAWSRCVAVAPFLSARRLHAEAGPAVRSLIDRLGGRIQLDDELGPRDLFQLGERIRTPVLILHGEHDDVIPVTQSRVLADRLRRAAAPVRYREIPTGGHNPLHEPGGEVLLDELVGFLLREDR